MILFKKWKKKSIQTYLKSNTPPLLNHDLTVINHIFEKLSSVSVIKPGWKTLQSHI